MDDHRRLSVALLALEIIGGLVALVGLVGLGVALGRPAGWELVAWAALAGAGVLMLALGAVVGVWVWASGQRRAGPGALLVISGIVLVGAVGSCGAPVWALGMVVWPVPQPLQAYPPEFLTPIATAPAPTPIPLPLPTPTPGPQQLVLNCPECAEAGIGVVLWREPERLQVAGMLPVDTVVTVVTQRVQDGRAIYYVRSEGDLAGWVVGSMVSPLPESKQMEKVRPVYPTPTLQPATGAPESGLPESGEPTREPTATLTPISVPPSPTAQPTRTPASTSTPTQTATATPSPTASPSPTATPAPTVESPLDTPTPTETPTPTASPTPTPTETATSTSTPTMTPTSTDEP